MVLVYAYHVPGGPWPRCFSQYHRACHATPLEAVFFHFNGDDRDGLSSGILLD
jgi:hypothetical protein